jgi:nitroreductase
MSHGFALADPLDLVMKLCRESRVQHEAGSVSPVGPAGNHTAGVTALVPLPAPRLSSRALDETIFARRAVRFYTPEAVPDDVLATLLSAAARGDREEWPAQNHAGVALRLIVVAWRVVGIAPAIYEYAPDPHALIRIGPAPDPLNDAKDLVLQTEFARSPLIILIAGNLAAASTRYGAWGHRQLLMRAGAAGQRLWLTTVALGLSGTVFAGFLPQAAHRAANIDGYRNAGLLAYACGYGTSQNEQREEGPVSRSVRSAEGRGAVSNTLM